MLPELEKFEKHKTLQKYYPLYYFPVKIDLKPGFISAKYAKTVVHQAIYLFRSRDLIVWRFLDKKDRREMLQKLIAECDTYISLFIKYEWDHELAGCMLFDYLDSIQDDIEVPIQIRQHGFLYSVQDLKSQVTKDLLAL